MLIGTIGESVMGEEEVWTLDKTSVIFDVRLSRMFSVESAIEAEQNLDPCLIKKQGTQDHALIPCQT
jgi:hypothetical protein